MSSFFVTKFLSKSLSESKSFKNSYQRLRMINILLKYVLWYELFLNYFDAQSKTNLILGKLWKLLTRQRFIHNAPFDILGVEIDRLFTPSVRDLFSDHSAFKLMESQFTRNFNKMIKLQTELLRSLTFCFLGNSNGGAFTQRLIIICFNALIIW